MVIMKLKYIKDVTLATAILFAMPSCDSFLDTTPEDLRSPEQIFSTYSSTENAMFGVYNYLRNVYPWNMPDTYSTSDNDVVYTNVQTFDLGQWDPTGSYYEKWTSFYKYIREATYFLQNLDKCQDTQLDQATREQWRAEVRCLRAYYYAQLMRMYGPVILLKDEQPDFTGTDMQRERDTWDECVEWISNEFWELANNSYLPTVQEGNNYGRMSQAIALGYRARILLQSASPQFNGNPQYANIRKKDGTPLFPTSYDANKWELARQAAQDVIDLGYYELVKKYYEDGDDEGVIDPYSSYKSVFTESQNKEMIFSYLEDNGTVDNRLTPNSLSCWGGGHNPTQEIVDAYAMDNGRYPIIGYTTADRDVPIIDEKSEYSEEGFSTFSNPMSATITTKNDNAKTFNMYVNREPRFYVSVFYGGMYWFPKKTSEQIYLEMFKNGNNGPDASHNHYSTGYNMIKLASPEYEANPRKNVKRELPYMRYAEILLNYVEAAIELNQLDDPNLFTYWNMVRERAGLPDIQTVYPEAVGDQTQLRDLIHRERRVEFAFEGLHFYDTRRWLTADETEKGNMHGMNIQASGKSGSNEYPEEFFQRTVFEKRVYNASYNLFPIPQSVMEKNPALVQNYKW